MGVEAVFWGGGYRYEAFSASQEVAWSFPGVSSVYP